MLPRVILYNAVSADGRLEGFTTDIELFYELARIWEEDATLAGSNTLIKAYEEEHIKGEDKKIEQIPEIETDDTRALLVVPDSKGRIEDWNFWKNQPYWRDVVVLCSRSTPKNYIDHLKEKNISHIVAGEEHVDMKSAFEELSCLYGVKVIRVDSGGTLNGVLLREGLVDEINLLIHPSLVGGIGQNSIFQEPEITSIDDVIQLKLIHLEKLENDMVWIRYEVR